MRATITMPIETLALIIAKARALEGEIDENEDDFEDDDEGAPEGDVELLAAGDNEEPVEDMDDDELTEVLGSLSDHELAELLALVWIGDGDFGLNSWDEALSKARTVSDEEVLSHLLGADDLADLIEDGLTELGYTVVIEDGEARP